MASEMECRFDLQTQIDQLPTDDELKTPIMSVPSNWSEKEPLQWQQSMLHMKCGTGVRTNRSVQTPRCSDKIQVQGIGAAI